MTFLNLHINGIGLKESLTDIRGITHSIIQHTLNSILFYRIQYVNATYYFV